MTLTASLDANGVIGLAKGGVFGLLSSLVTAAYIPPEVSEEVIIRGHGRAGASELAQALAGTAYVGSHWPESGPFAML